MKNWITLALLGPLVACGAATSAPNYAVASHVAAPDVSIEDYHTFAFGLAEQPRAGYDVTPRSLEVQRRVRAVVKTALEERGLAETTAAPELLVKLATGSGSGFGLRPPTTNVEYDPSAKAGPEPALGFIGIDIYASASGNEIWKGSAFAEVDPTKIDDALLRRGVDHMLEGFGPRRAESVAKEP